MTCKLCQKDSPLQNSHIIPEFVYTQLYDDKHRMNVLSLHEKTPRPYEQKGLREKLLCRDCEARLSVFEKYVSTAFDGKETEVPLDGVIIVKDVDYNQFKLFLLSILWRASVSSLDFFSQVSLGPHENKIREMILSNDPGPSDKYGVIPFALIDDGVIQSDIIMQPTRIKLYGRVGYRFVFGGFMWAFLVSGHQSPHEMKPLFPMKDNTLCIVKGDYRKCGIVTEFAKRLKEMGRI